MNITKLNRRSDMREFAVARNSEVPDQRNVFAGKYRGRTSDRRNRSCSRAYRSNRRSCPVAARAPRAPVQHVAAAAVGQRHQRALPRASPRATFLKMPPLLPEGVHRAARGGFQVPAQALVGLRPGTSICFVSIAVRVASLICHGARCAPSAP